MVPELTIIVRLPTATTAGTNRTTQKYYFFFPSAHFLQRSDLYINKVTGKRPDRILNGFKGKVHSSCVCVCVFSCGALKASICADRRHNVRPLPRFRKSRSRLLCSVTADKLTWSSAFWYGRIYFTQATGVGVQKTTRCTNSKNTTFKLWQLHLNLTWLTWFISFFFGK